MRMYWLRDWQAFLLMPMSKGKGGKKQGVAYLKVFDGQYHRQVAPEGYPKAGLPPSLRVLLG